jgi:hypothetical protein
MQAFPGFVELLSGANNSTGPSVATHVDEANGEGESTFEISGFDDCDEKLLSRIRVVILQYN